MGDSSISLAGATEIFSLGEAPLAIDKAGYVYKLAKMVIDTGAKIYKFLAF